jgi:hypothetical protein
MIQAEQRRKDLSRRFDMLGACIRKHVPHGEFVQYLKPGDLVEFRQCETWMLGSVLAFKGDFEGAHVRFIKVTVL